MVQQHLETKRLVLRTLCPDDAHYVFIYAANPRVALYTHWNPHTSLQETYSYLDSLPIYAHLQQSYAWGIELKAEKKIIGECGFIHIMHPQAELYYALAEEYWGQGFATEAVHVIIEYARTALHFSRLEAWVIAPNYASHNLAKKMGMQCETMLHNQWYDHDQLHTIYVYAKNFTAGHENSSGSVVSTQPPELLNRHPLMIETGANGK